MEKYDIILESGQSNAVGYGHGPAAKSYVPDPRVLYYTAGEPVDESYTQDDNYSVCVAGERSRPDLAPGDTLGDLSLSFAEKYLEAGLLAPDRKLLIVRTAVGGTGFLKHYWAVGDPLYQRMLKLTDEALALNPENRLVAMLWHQGEHEAAFLNDPQRYHHQLKAVVDGVRSRYGLPELPFVCGGFCQEWAVEHQPACDQIMDVIRGVAREVGGAYVETGDLRSNNQLLNDGDIIHFCKEDLQELGRRYFNAFVV